MEPDLHRQNGNALWFILVAIVLLGALTMILSRGGTSVNQSGDVEQARLRAGEIMRYAKGIETAIDQMKMRGVAENDVSFETAATGGTYANPNCADDDCKVFGTGGGRNYRTPPSGTNDGSAWIFTGDNNVGTAANPVGTSGARTGNDLVMLLPNANEAMCIQINRDLEVGTAGTIPEDTTGVATAPFTGAYDASLTEIDGDGTPFELDGKSAGCFTDTNANPDVTYFYYVLLAR